MAINVADGFQYLGKKSLDARTSYTTLASMKAVTDANINEGCFAYCEETDKYYKFLSTNTVDADTGKWREFEAGGGEDANAYHSTDATESALADSDKFPFYDASASAKRNSTWSNIKSVLKTYFDTLYNKYTLPTATASVLGGVKVGNSLSISDGVLDCSVPILGSINRSDIYDTTEKVIGKWTDGKPVYQKIIQFTSPTPTQEGEQVVSSYAVGVSVDKFVKIEGIINIGEAYCPLVKEVIQTTSIQATTTSEHFHGLRIVMVTGYSNSYSDSSMKNTIRIANSNVNYGNRAGYVIVQYTKTTDSANSYNYADENDYSTSEKIVGTWLDGKKLYQKTISCGTLPNNTSKNVAHGISNISRVVSIVGYAYRSSSVKYLPLPFVSANAVGESINISVDNTNISILTGYDRSTFTESYITLQYTKTTG